MGELSELFDLALAGEKQGVWFFGALYFLLVMSYSVVFQVRVRCWPIAQGYLTSAEVEKLGAASVLSEQDYRATALYTYEVDGSAYQGHRVSPWVVVASHNAKAVLKMQLSGISHTKDGGVEVAYSPRNPQKSYLIKPGIVGLLITITGALLPMVTYFLEYVF